jgi:hypothetical protein
MKRLLVSARKAEDRKTIAIFKLINYLEDKIGDLQDIPNQSAENANNLLEAILCHVDYGECDLEELLDDIQIALAERSNDDD